MKTTNEGNSGLDGNDARIEIYRERYKHELQLGQHTSALEHAGLRPVILLNGGAVVAFLTLLGSVWKAEDRPDMASVGSALAVWCAGLVLGALATGLAYGSQRTLQRMIRMQRETIERELLGEPEGSNEAQVKEAYRKGKAFQRGAESLVIVGLAAFIFGVYFAFQSLK